MYIFIYFLKGKINIPFRHDFKELKPYLYRSYFVNWSALPHKFTIYNFWTFSECSPIMPRIGMLVLGSGSGVGLVWSNLDLGEQLNQWDFLTLNWGKGRFKSLMSFLALYALFQIGECCRKTGNKGQRCKGQRHTTRRNIHLTTARRPKKKQTKTKRQN